MTRRWIACAVFSALASACGGASSPRSGAVAADSDAGAFTITISNFTFSPTNLTVPPCATVTVVNKDSVTHSVTSQSAPGKFTFGSVAGVSFDTGPFTGTKTFTIPGNAPDGTVVPYFCTVHRQGMANSAQITISASAGGMDGGMSDGGVCPSTCDGGTCDGGM